MLDWKGWWPMCVCVSVDKDKKRIMMSVMVSAK